MDTEELTAASIDCFDLRDWLSWQCCDSMPSLSECEATVKQTILTDDTHITQTVVPITKGATLDVEVSAYVSSVSIVNYGVDGGAVEVTGSLMLSWADERLGWDSLKEGCSSITVQEFDIWVPKLVQQDGSAETDTLEVSDIDVLADGRIFWNREIRMWASCETPTEMEESASKVCTIKFLDDKNIGKVRYVTDGNRKAISIDDEVSLPQYKFNEDETTIVVGASVNTNDGVQNTRMQLIFDPLDTTCNICDSTGKLTNGTIHYLREDWLELFPNQTEEGFQCFKYNELLSSNYDVGSQECVAGRANFEEACCDDDDTFSTYD
eukprot:1548293-Ditylum_brightwellii.AAC.1